MRRLSNWARNRSTAPLARALGKALGPNLCRRSPASRALSPPAVAPMRPRASSGVSACQGVVLLLPDKSSELMSPPALHPADPAPAAIDACLSAESRLRALASRQRLSIRRGLHKGAMRIPAHRGRIDLAQPALSRRLASLRSGGLVATRRAALTITGRLDRRHDRDRGPTARKAPTYFPHVTSTVLVPAVPVPSGPI